MDGEQVAAVRRFNRLVTQRAGALEEHFLGRERPLGESRVLYEIGAEGASLRALRGRLSLDSGYLSRLTAALERRGLVATEPQPDDERVRFARLTTHGAEELAEIDRRSDEAAERILARLSEPERDRLVRAMEAVRRLLTIAGLDVARADPAGAEARACLDRYFAELAERFEEGFDPALSVAPDVSDLVPPVGAFLVARVDGSAVACGGIKRTGPATAYIKRMWVDGSLRGLGLGRRMLHALEDQARELGCDTVQLETNRSLRVAIAMYRRAGYREVEPFNDEPYAHHWFEKRLG